IPKTFVCLSPKMKFLTLALALASAANAHTLLSELYINGKSQGDATCLRMPKEGDTSTSPVAGLTSDDMACGKDGEIAAAYTCAAPGSSKLTFEFREWPDARAEGSIDSSHKGPCAVYVKKVDDMAKTSAAGPGWFKIWDEGYDESTKQWCVDKLIANKGLLTVELPSGLPAGYYLIRTEILALHQAVSLKDPQYYVGCAQVYVQDGPSGSLEIPAKNSVSIPGYIDGSEPGNNFNLYDNPKFPYPIPGPEVYSPVGSSTGASAKSVSTFEGGVPDDCLIKNANWCGKPLEKYSSETGCWAAVDACYAQGDKCFNSAPPTGAKNCYVWNDNMCKAVESQCRAKNFNGPPTPNLEEKDTPLPGPIPGAPSTSAPAPAATSSAAAVPAPAPSSPAQGGLKVSTDGTCGGETGLTCEGSSFGPCCNSGRCTNKKSQCKVKCGCEQEFGLCLKGRNTLSRKH
ncbi:putative endo-beta-1,4-glucanase D 3, partial [Colletotrichum chlorophyti]